MGKKASPTDDQLRDKICAILKEVDFNTVHYVFLVLVSSLIELGHFSS